MIESPQRLLLPPDRLWSRNFALFFGARGVAKLGDGMLPVALAAGLIQHGMGAGGIGLAMASLTACFAGFVIFGGVFCDRFEPLRLMIAADLVRVGTQALAAGLFFSGHVVLWQICLIGAVNGLAAGLFQPGVAGMMPRVARDVQTANGAIRTAESLAMLLGPALAGLLVSVVTPGGVFAAHSATYALGATFLAFLRLPAERPSKPLRAQQPAARQSTCQPAGTQPPGNGTAGGEVMDAGTVSMEPAASEAVQPPGAGRTPHSAGYWADLAEGWREFRARTWMWGVIVFWMVMMIAVTGPLVPLVSTLLIPEHGASSFGIVNAALGGGTALGGLLGMRLRPVRQLRAGAIALFGYSLLPAAVGTGLSVPSLAACAVVSGAAMGFWGVMWMTSIVTQVPRPVLNRIHAFEISGSLAMMPVGQVLAGPAAGVFGAGTVLLFSGGMVLVVATGLLLVPAIRTLQRVPAEGAVNAALRHGGRKPLETAEAP